MLTDYAYIAMLVAISTATTMTFGNIMVLRQTNRKRLLTYSSIAQAGYMLMGAAAVGRNSLALSGKTMLFGAAIGAGFG